MACSVRNPHSRKKHPRYTATVYLIRNFLFDFLFDEFDESQTFLPLPHQNQTSVGSDPRSLESDRQKAVERQLQSLFLALIPWVYTSVTPSWCCHPHQYRRCRSAESSSWDFKLEMPDKAKTRPAITGL